MNDQHNTSESSHTSWTYFLRVMTSWHIMWWGCQPPRVWRRGNANKSSHHQLSQLAHHWHRKLWSECASILHWCASCSSPELIFVYEHDIKLHLVLHVGKIDLRGCSMSIVVAGSKCGAHKQGEWLIIGRTLFSSTHWCFIHRKCPHMSSASRNMESSTSRITTEYELKNG